MREHIRASLQEAQEALTALIANEEAQQNIAVAANLLARCFQAKGHVFSCGNGGSMCDAMHFAEELSGRFRRDRPALGAIAIADGAHLTCVGNDFGFACLQIEGGRCGAGCRLFGRTSGLGNP